MFEAFHESDASLTQSGNQLQNVQICSKHYNEHKSLCLKGFCCQMMNDENKWNILISEFGRNNYEVRQMGQRTHAFNLSLKILLYFYMMFGEKLKSRVM